MKRAAVLLATGFEEVEAVTIIDVLRRGGVEAVVVGVDGAEVTGAHGISIKSDCLMVEAQPEYIDAVVLPGGLDGVKVLAKDGRIKRFVTQMHEAKKIVAAICAAPIALDAFGVLKGEYTCYTGANKEIQGGTYTNTKNVVHTDNIITSKGPATAMEFALYLVKVLNSHDKYLEVKGALLA